MIVKVTVCRLDGSQTVEMQELPDDWFGGAAAQEKAEK